MGWCWHTWKVVEKKELESKAEQLHRLGGDTVAAYMLNRPWLITYRCEKCGAETVKRI